MFDFLKKKPEVTHIDTVDEVDLPMPPSPPEKLEPKFQFGAEPTFNFPEVPRPPHEEEPFEPEVIKPLIVEKQIEEPTMVVSLTNTPYMGVSEFNQMVSWMREADDCLEVAESTFLHIESLAEKEELTFTRLQKYLDDIRKRLMAVDSQLFER
ncbi:MAG: hypothetical protein ABIG95_03920 [Candidatus Woesearchaeota archaeon]